MNIRNQRRLSAMALLLGAFFTGLLAAADPGIDIRYGQANTELEEGLEAAGEDEAAQKKVFASHAAKLFDLANKYSGETADQVLIESAVFFSMGGDMKASDQAMTAALKRVKTWKMQFMALEAASSIPGRENSARKIAAALLPAAKMSTSRKEDLMPILQKLDMIKEMGELRGETGGFAPAAGSEEDAEGIEVRKAKAKPQGAAKAGAGEDVEGGADANKNRERPKGPMVPDFTARTFDNNRSFSLSDYRGKVVIVDFWATWCGPCMEEMPEVIELYREYHDRGLEIIGVSLDQDMGTLQRFLDQSRIPWVQVCDGGGWKAALAEKFGVKSIPQAMLIDRDGTLIGKGLRSNDLARLLEEVMSE